MTVNDDNNTKPKTTMKLLLKSLLLLFLTIIVLLSILLVWLKTDEGIKTITDFIVDYVEKNTDHHYKIKLEDLQFSFPLVIEAKEVSLNDKDGQIIFIKRFHINILPSLLWLQQVTILDLSAEEIILSKIPNSDLNNTSSDVNRYFDFIPKITIQNIAVHKITLAPIVTNLAEEIRLNLNGNLLFDNKDTTIQFLAKLKDDTEALPLLNDAILEIHGKVNVIKDNINIDEFTLSSSHSNIKGTAIIDYKEDFIDAHATYKSSILEQIFLEQKSMFEGVIDFSGSPSSPRITTKGSGYLDSGQKYFQLPKFTWNSDLIIDKDNMNGKIELSSSSIKAKGEISKNGQKFYLKNFNARGNNLISSANLIFDNQIKILTGEFNANSSNINELKEFFPFLRKGSLNIKTTYKEGSNKTQQLTLIGDVRQLFTDFVNCDAASMNLSIKDLWNFKLDQADIKLKSVSYGDSSLKNLDLKAKNMGDFINFESYVKSLDPYNVSLKINGKIIGAPKKIEIINNVTGKIGKLNISNQEPIRIKINNGFSVSAPKIKINDGKLKLDLNIDDFSKIKGKILTENFPIFFAELLSDALISGIIELEGTVKTPTFKSDLTISNIPNLTTLKLSADFYNNQLSINFNLTQNNQSIGNFKAKLPYKLSLSPLEANLLKQAPIDIKLQLNQETNILGFIPLSPGHKLVGYANGQMHISGSIQTPIINGSIYLNKTEYNYKPYGIALKDISTTISAKNQNILITNFVAKDIHSNVIEGNGSLSILNNLPFKFNLKTNKFQFISAPFLQGFIAGNLLISGDNQKALAKGHFDLGPMEIKIPEHFSDNIPTINIIKTTNHDKITNIAQSKSYPLELDLDLTAKREVYVRGLGVDTLLSGSLKITNQITNPNVFGKLKSVKGRYQEFGKVLTVKHGVLTFDGPISPSPYLNIVGVTVVDGVEIRLILYGSIFKPDITIESTPSLSQESALSLLLFGKNTENISTFQALTLANSMSRLSGHGGVFDPLALGRKILGVDDISIKNNENNTTASIGIGKYLTDKVYLEIDQGDEASGTKTKIEIELTPKISIEGITDEFGNSSFGVNWRFDY